MWVCLLTWDCLLLYNFHNMAYNKMFNLVKWGVELKMNWLNWSIPISSGFQFQFNSNSKSFNSIPIQFMLNWIELIINSNSIHELIRALNMAAIFQTTFSNVFSWMKMFEFRLWFHWSLLLRFQLTINQHWFNIYSYIWFGAEQVTSRRLNRGWPSPPMFMGH